jgi:hypothetical protein
MRNFSRAAVVEFIQEAEEFPRERFEFLKFSVVREHPFSHPYYWDAFRFLGYPELIFKGMPILPPRWIRARL